MPFYRRLAAIRTASQGRLRVLAIAPKASETELETKAHFSEQGIALDGAQAISFSAIGVLGTPTVALVGSDGAVVAVWTGKLPQEKETQMVERIFAVCRGCIRENGRGN